MRVWRQFSTAVIVLIAVIACQVDQRAEYTVIHINAGSQPLDNVSVKYDDFESLCGVLPPAAEKGQSGVKVPVPSAVKVVWTTPDGRDHEQLVTVRGERPFRDLVVTIDGARTSASLR